MDERQPLLGGNGASTSSSGKVSKMTSPSPSSPPISRNLSSTQLYKKQEKRGGVSVRRAFDPATPVLSINDMTNSTEELLGRGSDYGIVSSMSSHHSQTSMSSVAASGVHQRYRFYSRLTTGPDRHFLMPDHVVPPEFFFFLPFHKKGGKQSSLITIFSIWNTMMGTSLLSIPWGIQQAGFTLGIIVMITMAAVAFYTAYRVLNSLKDPALNGTANEFSDVCRFYLGRVGEWMAILFSLVALLGAIIVYYVLLTNFLFNSVDFVHAKFTGRHTANETHYAVTIYNRTYTDVFCKNFPPFDIHVKPSVNQPSLLHMYNDMNVLFPEAVITTPSTINHTTTPIYDKLWSQNLTVPFWLLLLIFPLISIKSPTFFAKFTALGTLSVAYLIVLVIIKGVNWGIHMDLTATDIHLYIPEFKVAFLSLSGICALAFFIHNVVITLTSVQQNPENNARDLFIAFVLVASTYLGVGIFYYVVFPLPKSCIEDNFLNNITPTDLLAFIGRIALFFQMTTVYPLVVYIFRAQLMQAVFGKVYPSFLHVFCLHLGIMSLSVLFAMFVPSIGSIIRFSGALCGCVCMFTLPVLVHMKSNELSTISKIFHITLIVAGVTNFLGQFVITFLGS